jgi:alkaline phosphatase D
MGNLFTPKDALGWIGPNPDPRAKAIVGGGVIAAAAGIPGNMDSWGGYPQARARLLQAAQAADSDMVVVSGDSHNAWAFNLADKAGPVGVEFAGQSVSSNGMERRFNGDVARVAADFVKANPALRWMDASQRGYMVLDIGRDRVETEYVFLPTGAERNPVAAGTKKIVAERGARKLTI